MVDVTVPCSTCGTMFSPSRIGVGRPRTRCDACRPPKPTSPPVPRNPPIMTGPDDPRHGTERGYAMGCRCDECKVARKSKNDHRKAQGFPNRTKGVRTCSRCSSRLMAGRSDLADKPGLLCGACRRDDAAEMAEIERRIRAGRPVVIRKPRKRAKTTGKPYSSGRAGTGHTRYRRLRLIVLGASDICGICGHGGALTVDHIIPHARWPKGTPGFDELSNMQPAHGTMKPGETNPCPICKRLCNQHKSQRLLPSVTMAGVGSQRPKITGNKSILPQ